VSCQALSPGFHKIGIRHPRRHALAFSFSLDIEQLAMPAWSSNDVRTGKAALQGAVGGSTSYPPKV